ncbi:unnamed protein product [Anisakis simplex]|uniref:Nephrocystin-4-like protein (inferred by orthology to a C. elegans protein) n=1 Tax=Anisakis simplex TaxID=6269 RepID=A0A0M3JS93_ANISI|nr:unnamed protein product [Anisakis simplex]
MDECILNMEDEERERAIVFQDVSYKFQLHTMVSAASKNSGSSPTQTPNSGINIDRFLLCGFDLKLGLCYRLNICFYDRSKRVFFGRPFRSDWISSDDRSSSIQFDELIFFHTSIKDDQVYVVIEVLVNERPNAVSTSADTPHIFSLAWTVCPLHKVSTSVHELNSKSAMEQLYHSRFCLYRGSPILLMFLTDDKADLAESLPKAGGAMLELCLQTHQNLMKLADFIPEFCIVAADEAIPGMKIAVEDDASQSFVVLEEACIACVIDEIVLSFSTQMIKFEQVLIELLNNDRLYRANKSPNDKHIKPLEVLERRLKVGIHNGFVYVDEPQCFHFSSLHEAEDTLTRRKLGSLRGAKSCSDLLNSGSRNESTLFLRNNITLKRLVVDVHYAIVFALEYLVGVRTFDGTASSSQTVMIGWSAWCPFAASASDGTSTHQRISIPLTGGPCLNADETLCFNNNLMRCQRDKWTNDSGDYQSLSLSPTIHLHFTYDAQLRRSRSEVGELNLGERMYDRRREMDDVPLLDRTPSIVTDRSLEHEELIVDGDKREKHSIVAPLTPAARRSGRASDGYAVVKARRRSSTIGAGQVRPQAEPQTEANRFADGSSAMTETQGVSRDKTRGRPHVFVGHSTGLKTISNIPKETLNRIMQPPSNFTQIYDRNRNRAVLVDIHNIKEPNLNVELNDRLNTNEVVLQFLALTEILVLCNENVVNDSPRVYVLKRSDSTAKLIDEQGYGFTVKYTVDRRSIPDDEPDDFISYLCNQNLQIDVWDATSLIPIGCANVALKYLLRQGREAVEACVQVPIVQSALPDPPEVHSILMLRLANIGHPSTKHIDLTCSRTPAIVSQRLGSCMGVEGVESYRIRAKPLNPAQYENSTMQRFMAAQKLDLKLRYDEIFNEQSLKRIQNFRNASQLQSTTCLTTKSFAFSQLSIWDILFIMQGSVKRFLFHQELEAYKKIRNENKASKLLKAVFKAISTEHRLLVRHYFQNSDLFLSIKKHFRIFACYGQIHFFEFLLQNSESEPLDVLIDITGPALRLFSRAVLNVDEWQFFKRRNDIETPIVKDLFVTKKIRNESGVDDVEQVQIQLKPLQSVFIPFKYDAFLTSSKQRSRTEHLKVIFKRVDNGEPLAIIDVQAQNRANIISQSLRFFVEAEMKLTKVIRICGTKDGRYVMSVRCSDPTVLLSVRDAPDNTQDIVITCHTSASPSLRSFIVLLYADRYNYELIGVWAIHLHSAHKIQAKTVQAQRVQLPLLLKLVVALILVSGYTYSLFDAFRTDGNDHCVQLFSSCTSRILLHPSEPFLTANTRLHEIDATFMPDFIGDRTFLITAIDIRSHQLLNEWLLYAQVDSLDVNKIYRIRLPVKRTLIKKIPLTNEYGIARAYRLVSSQPDLLTIDDEIVYLEAHSATQIALTFLPYQMPFSVEVFLFVLNADDDLQEQVFSIRIQYFEE